MNIMYIVAIYEILFQYFSGTLRKHFASLNEGTRMYYFVYKERNWGALILSSMVSFNNDNGTNT